MTEKEVRHQRANEFRLQIAMPVQRAAAIRDLATKEKYDDSDKLRISLLFNKVSLTKGCEDEYRELIVHLYQTDLKAQAKAFCKKWNG